MSRLTRVQLLVVAVLVVCAAFSLGGAIGTGIYYLRPEPANGVVVNQPTATPRPTQEPAAPTLRPPTPTTRLSPAMIKSNWKTVDIRAFAKNPDAYVDVQVRYEGEVFRIQEDRDGAAIQAWVDIPGGSEFDREAVVIFFPGRTGEIYEGTFIEVWGYGGGSFEGTNAFGAQIKQPVIIAEYLSYSN